jgi:hypothetical protein
MNKQASLRAFAKTTELGTSITGIKIAPPFRRRLVCAIQS